MAKNDFEDGVWRTVGGRRIFIRDGESLSTAMKKSGKFKSAKKKVDYDKRPQSDVDKENERNNKAVEKIEKGQKDFDPQDFENWRKEVDPDYEMDDDKARLRYEAYKDTNVRNQYAKQKETQKIKVDKNDLETLRKIADNYEDINKYEGLDDIAKDYIENRRKENAQNEFTKKANEIHEKTREKAIETEKTTDEDKRYNTKQDNEPKTFFEGKKDIEEEARQIYAEDGIRATSERNIEYLAKKYEIPKTQAKAFMEDTMKRFDEDNKKANIANGYYKKAFEEYMKKHPNSKLTLNKFIDMSEGK